MPPASPAAAGQASRSCRGEALADRRELRLDRGQPVDHRSRRQRFDRCAQLIDLLDRRDPSIVADSALQAAERQGVTFRDVTTISLGGGKGTIAHVVNDAGDAATAGAVRQTLTRYPVER